MFRDGLFPAKRIGRLIFAAYEDVKCVVTEGASSVARVDRAIKAAVEKPEIDVAKSEEEARRHLHSARTPKELRERKKEVQERAWDLMRQYEKKLDDGTPNPNHNKILADRRWSPWCRSRQLRQIQYHTVKANSAGADLRNSHSSTLESPT